MDTVGVMEHQEVFWFSMTIDRDRRDGTVMEAERWAEKNLGDGFFKFGSRYFFADEGEMLMFRIRCLSK